ncbi:MAG: hypothetical protein ACI4Q3_10360 [Kiritimatiellia bacterium]
MKIEVLLLSALLGGALFAATPVNMDVNGKIVIGENGPAMQLTIPRKDWGGNSTGNVDLEAGGLPEGETKVYFFSKDDVRFAYGTVKVAAKGKNAFGYSVTLEGREDYESAGVFISVELPIKYAGASIAGSDGSKATIPVDFDRDKPHGIYSADLKSVTVAAGTPDELRFDLPETMNVYVQDNRQWGPNFSIRISLIGESAKIAKGDRRDFSLNVTLPGEIAVKAGKLCAIGRDDKWLPITNHKTIAKGSALDLSESGIFDAPAGKYGWLKNDRSHLVFEKLPGRVQRFYGANMCHLGAFLDRNLADEVVERFLRTGYNTMRIHHYEKGFVKKDSDTMAFDMKGLAKLDYLIAKAIERGIYITTDLFVSRPVKWRAIGIDRDGEVPMQIYKALVALYEPAFEDFARFVRLFMNHVNPYTGRAYKDEPGLPFISVLNENDIGCIWLGAHNTAEFKQAWREWLKGERDKDPAFAPGISDDAAQIHGGEDAVFIKFTADMERRLIARCRALFKEIGMKQLITEQNAGGYNARFMAMREEMYDYTDTHFYIDHPHFLGRNWKGITTFRNTNPLQYEKPQFLTMAFMRNLNQPFMVTEWNFCAPGKHRGMGGMVIGTIAALQDWSALYRFEYAGNDWFTRETYLNPDPFSLVADAINRLSDRAMVCLFLRGDMKPLDDAMAVQLTAEAINKTKGGIVPIAPKWVDAAWQTRVGCAVEVPPGMPFRTLDDVLASDRPVWELQENRSVRVDRARGSFMVATARTCGGFVPNGKLAAGLLEFDAGDDLATIWASSSDGKPLASSDRMVLTHLTDSLPDGTIFADETRSTLISWGIKTRELLVRRARASIALKLDQSEDYEVYGLDLRGIRTGKVESAVKNGRLCFVADVKGPEEARMLYEIVRKTK